MVDTLWLETAHLLLSRSSAATWVRLLKCIFLVASFRCCYSLLPLRQGFFIKDSSPRRLC